MYTYSETKTFTKEALFDLFDSVGWESAKYSNSLVIVMKNSDRVISAWNGDQLIGLMSAMSDGIMTVYFHYLLVNPDYQGKGIGGGIVDKMLMNYTEYYKKVLIAYEDKQGFYEKCGFKVSDNTVAMSLTKENVSEYTEQ